MSQSVYEANKASKAQITCISALINKLGLQEHKAAIVSGASNGRTESRGKLTNLEAIACIKYLKSIDPDEVSAEKMRKKIISRFHEMRYHKPGTREIDMIAVDSWCTNYGYGHKHLNSYTLAELQKLVTQVDAVYDSYLKTL